MRVPIQLSRKFSPQSMFEPIHFGVRLELDSSIPWVDAYAHGFDLARKVIAVGAKPILSALSPRLTQKNVPAEADSPPTVVVPTVGLAVQDGVELVALTLEFGQTWQVDKPYRATVAPSTQLDVDLDGRSLEQAVSESWETLIVAVYKSVGDLLVAGGRWQTRMKDVA